MLCANNYLFIDLFSCFYVEIICTLFTAPYFSEITFGLAKILKKEI